MTVKEVIETLNQIDPTGYREVKTIDDKSGFTSRIVEIDPGPPSEHVPIEIVISQWKP